jgi:hypothetical protein
LNTSELLLLAAKAGMKFWLDGDRLAFRVPNEAMTPELRKEVIRHKEDLIALLRKDHLDAISPITRVVLDEKNGSPLASGQERLWLIESRIGPSPVHNVHFRLLWKGILDRELLAQSLRDIVARHDALRMTFTEIDGVPRAIISSDTVVDLVHLDLRDYRLEGKVSAMDSFIIAHQRTPFDFERGPLMRTAIITLDDDDHIILVTQHHIITDGWSVGIFLDELGRCYRARYLGHDAPLPQIPLRYSDYAHWQQEYRAQRPYQERLAWWKEHLSGLSRLELPGARSIYEGAPDYSGTTQDFSVDFALAARLKDLAREQHCTIYTVLLTAWVILLHRYANQSAFAVGTVTSGRDQVELDKLIGFFTNIVVLRCDLSGNPSAVDAIERLRAETESSFEREVQFADVVLTADAVREASLNPFVKVAFIFENIPIPDILNPKEIPGFAANVMLDPRIDGSAQGTSKFDLTLYMQESHDGIRGVVKYAHSQFEETAFRRLGEHFVNLLQSIVHDPYERVGKLELMSTQERKELLAGWGEINFLADWNEPESFGL